MAYNLPLRWIDSGLEILEKRVKYIYYMFLKNYFSKVAFLFFVH